uniref:Retroviral polymerase SH3-like domain-containing protein n=1 Tax=Brassica oleracea var. oleracea TaxID=109376 RepID=A0A0D2ZUC8_BRAOL
MTTATMLRLVERDTNKVVVVSVTAPVIEEEKDVEWTSAYVHIDDAARSKLDSKSKKCYFIGYGNAEFGYRFWDDENRKIIRSKNVVFNEEALYKDKLREGSEKKEPGAVDLEDILTPELPQDTATAEEEISQDESGEAEESDDSEVVPYTPVTELRRSSKIIRKPVRFSPSLNYILLTDRGEPDCYDEAMQVDETIKWELAMNDEMDSLLSNHTWELADLPKEKKALHNKRLHRIIFNFHNAGFHGKETDSHRDLVFGFLHGASLFVTESLKR